MRQRRMPVRLGGSLLLMSAIVAGTSGCVLVPAPGPTYVAGPPVVVAPRPVIVAPAPVYGYGYYRWGWR